MSTIQASFPENIFFSSQENYKELSDFFFSVHINCDKLKTETPENLPIIQIKGIKKFFYINAIKKHTQSISMRFCDTLDNFIADFRPIGEDNNWSTPPDYNASSDTLTFSCNENPLFTPNYTVGFELSTKCTFRKSLINNEPIILEVLFKNFDSIFDGLDNEINASYTIYAKDVPYVENVAVLNSEGKEVKTVLKGESVTITWTVGNDNKTSVSLCDEIGNTVTTVPPYKVQINEDRRFTLKLEKDGRTVSLPVPVNQISPVEVAVFNENGNRWWYDGDPDTNNIATITWSGDNIEKCTVSLCDKNGVVVATKSPYKLDRREYEDIYTLKIEREDNVVTKIIPIYSYRWRIDRHFKKLEIDKNFEYKLEILDNCVKNSLTNYDKHKEAGVLVPKLIKDIRHNYFLFKKIGHPIADDKGSNLFFYKENITINKDNICKNGFFIYIHPEMWFFDTTESLDQITYVWHRVKKYDNSPNWKDFKCYKTSSPKANKEIFVCYTFNDRITIRRYYCGSAQWDNEITIKKECFDQFANKDKDGDFLFCQGSYDSNSHNNMIYAVYQHAVYLYELNYSTKSLGKNHCKLTLPEEAKGTNIISISNNDNTHSAILCDNNYVYLFDSDITLSSPKHVHSFHLDYLKNPKDVLCGDKVTVDGHVIFENIIRSSFSPKQTVKNPDNMFFGLDKDNQIKALTWDHEKKTFWEYDR